MTVIKLFLLPTGTSVIFSAVRNKIDYFLR